VKKNFKKKKKKKTGDYEQKCLDLSLIEYDL
jgi:hypothetical protein